MNVKKRRIGKKDWQQVEDYIKREFSRRKNDSFRKNHETVWKEVDRQVSMTPPKRIYKDIHEKRNDWHNAIELGELAKASEILTADAVRLVFPNTRAWMEAHVELPPQLDPQTGENTVGQKEQIFADGVLRALMSQQHIDFGFKERFRLSVKEALHHGSFVAEPRWESALLVHNGSGIASISAPVWHPYSMWNCYPDPSPSVIGANMFYTGSMLVVEYQPLWKLRETASKGLEEGWMPAQLAKVPKRQNKNKDVETQDVELKKYFGDLVIKRDDGDIYLPNSKCITANDIIVFYSDNKLPFPPIIYGGYERQDVRDPYYTSPLIKLSPIHKAATVTANKLLDAIALKTEPPTLYDGNDPSFVMNGGPVYAPGWKGPTKGSAKTVQLETGDPTFALQALQLFLEQLQGGTSVDAVRAGAGSSSDQTATESRLKSMKGEIRIVDFVDKLEFSLKTFLYMQHEINKQEMDMYAFYNPEMDAPDFMRVMKEELPKNVHFDIVGARGILGEEERAQKMTIVTSFALGNPLTAPLVKPLDLLKEMYQDAGAKNPERFLNMPDSEVSQAVDMVKQEAQQAMQELEEKNFELEKELAITKAVNGAKIEEANIKGQSQAGIAEFKAQLQGDLEILKANLKTLESGAKVNGSNQVSIKEVGNVVEAFEKLLDSVKTSQESRDTEVTKKVDGLADVVKELVAHSKKPMKLKVNRGKDGRMAEVVGSKE